MSGGERQLYSSVGFEQEGDLGPLGGELAEIEQDSSDVKIRNVSELNKRLAQMLEQHPEADTVVEKFAYTIRMFNMLEEAGKLRTGYDSPEGPSIAITHTSAGMVELKNMGEFGEDESIADARLKQDYASMYQFAFVSLYKDDNPAVRAQSIDKTMQTLKLMEELYIINRHLQNKQYTEK